MNKSLIINSIYLFLKVFFNLIVSLYCSRLILESLGVVDFGIYNVVGGIVTIATFMTGAMSSASQRYFSYEIGKDNGNLDAIFSASINIYLILTLVIILLAQTVGFWFVENKINIPPLRKDAAIITYTVSVVTFVFSILVAPFNALIIANEKMKAYALLGVINTVFKLVLIFGLFLFDGSEDKLILYSILMFILSLLNFFITIIYVHITLKNVKYRFEWDFSLIKEISSYTSWSIIGNLSLVGVNQGLNIVINLFFGPVLNASRGIAIQVSSALISFSSNVTNAISPQIIKRYSSSEIESMRTIVFNGAKYTFMILAIMSTPVLLNTNEVLIFWLGIVPDNSIEFVRLIIIDSLICSFSSTLIIAIQATGKIKYYQIFVGGILLLNVPISYILLTYIKEPMVPFFVLISLSLLALNVRLHFTGRHIKIGCLNFYRKVMVKPVLSFVLTMVVLHYIDLEFNFNIIINIFMSVTIMMISFYLFSFDSYERRYIKSLFKKNIK